MVSTEVVCLTSALLTIVSPPCGVECRRRSASRGRFSPSSSRSSAAATGCTCSLATLLHQMTGSPPAEPSSHARQWAATSGPRCCSTLGGGVVKHDVGGDDTGGEDVSLHPRAQLVNGGEALSAGSGKGTVLRRTLAVPGVGHRSL
jgi:hypothetical protein